MKDSAGGERLPAPGTGQRPALPSSPARTPTQGPEFFPAGEDSLPHPATEAAQPLSADAPGWERIPTATGGPRPGGASGQGQAWRAGRFPRRPPRRRHWRRAGATLTAVLLIACGIVVYLRLHHAPLTVTGAAITSQVKSGCAVDVTGRISTSGGAGTVAYQWVFTPQVTAPQPLSQSVTAGQTAVYVTVSVQGTGHGQAAQQVTLQVLGPGQGSASTHVNISC